MKKNKLKREWIYSEMVKKHFFNPQNILLKNPKKGEFDAEGKVGSPACGDVMKMWLKLAPTKASGGDPLNRRVKKLKWRTFGCASAIASTSVFSQMITEHGGMKLEEALKITPQDVIRRLGGLPPYKIHCSVLADQAFKKTVENYLKNL
jgi:NifU-like protein